MTRAMNLRPLPEFWVLSTACYRVVSCSSDQHCMLSDTGSALRGNLAQCSRHTLLMHFFQERKSVGWHVLNLLNKFSVARAKPPPARVIRATDSPSGGCCWRYDRRERILNLN